MLVPPVAFVYFIICLVFHWFIYLLTNSNDLLYLIVYLCLLHIY
jgi:hypothetical protein